MVLIRDRNKCKQIQAGLLESFLHRCSGFGSGHCYACMNYGKCFRTALGSMPGSREWKSMRNRILIRLCRHTKRRSIYIQYKLPISYKFKKICRFKRKKMVHQRRRRDASYILILSKVEQTSKQHLLRSQMH